MTLVETGVMMKPTLLVLAAGMGSRYGGVKQIDAVGKHNETLLDFATYDAMKSGFGKVVYIIRKDIEKDFRERLFDRVAQNFDAEYVFQTHESLLTARQIADSVNRKKPWGTLHAILCARDSITTPFVVINADDYYGRDAFTTMYSHLAQLNPESTEHAMVGYVLENTMSKSGSVSRGICSVSDGYLASMREHTKISYEDERIVSLIDEGKTLLTGKEWVSMNFFGFTPRAFDEFGMFFEKFIATHVTSEKAEALLPEAASSIVVNGKGKIRFYTSTEKWFGMTYPEDRLIVKEEIAGKISLGYYPEFLWDKN
jgi:NDP-sugar pyrophosphorylase family protein